MTVAVVSGGFRWFQGCFCFLFWGAQAPRPWGRGPTYREFKNAPPRLPRPCPAPAPSVSSPPTLLQPSHSTDGHGGRHADAFTSRSARRVAALHIGYSAMYPHIPCAKEVSGLIGVGKAPRYTIISSLFIPRDISSTASVLSILMLV